MSLCAIIDESLKDITGEVKWWDGEKLCLGYKDFRKSSTTNVSVFKVRGPGSAQPKKVNEYEHQLIDEFSR